jgi:hypothetical protein
MPKNIDQVRQRVDGLAEKLAALNIDAQDIPEILEQAMDVVHARGRPTRGHRAQRTGRVAR